MAGCAMPMQRIETIDQPADGHTEMLIGLTNLRDERMADRLHRMLLLPFSESSSEYPINRSCPEIPQPSENDSDG